MKNLLVALDFSPVTPVLLEQTRQIAKLFDSQVWLLHVAQPDPDFIGYETGSQTQRNHVADHLREDHQKLHQFGETLRSEGIDTTALLIQGATVEKILQEAKKLEITLIIIGYRHHNPLQKIFKENIQESILQQSNCPVLVVPQA